VLDQIQLPGARRGIHGTLFISPGPPRERLQRQDLGARAFITKAENAKKSLPTGPQPSAD
jgi:hypothetical protein